MRSAAKLSAQPGFIAGSNSTRLTGGVRRLQAAARNTRLCAIPLVNLLPSSVTESFGGAEPGLS